MHESLSYIADKAEQELKEIERQVRFLQVIDWDEVLDFVPNSDDLKNEIYVALTVINESVQELKSL